MLLSRPARLTLAVATAVACAGFMVAPAAAGDQPASTQAPGTATSRHPQADEVLALVRTTMRERHLRSVIIRVSENGRNVVTRALGTSMTGVPATTDMHFRNGAVAISYMATLLLQLVDEKRVSLDDKVSRWLPNLPHADEVTLGQLARMTSGYPDYVRAPGFDSRFYADPFAEWTTKEKLALVVNEPLLHAPGDNWNYAHTNYVILGLALERITGKPLQVALRERVLEPLGLDNTADPGTPQIPSPVLHSFTSERRESLGIPAGTRFYEESTFWNPSWTLARGAIQYTNIHDLHDSAIAIGTGTLLSRQSYRAMVSTDLRGFGGATDTCPLCHTQDERYSYGIGLVTTGNWVKQNPMFAGEAGVMAYLPSQGIAIAIAVTYDEAAFDAPDGPPNEADMLFRKVGALLAPGDAPPQ